MQVLIKLKQRLIQKKHTSYLSFHSFPEESINGFDISSAILPIEANIKSLCKILKKRARAMPGSEELTNYSMVVLLQHQKFAGFDPMLLDLNQLIFEPSLSLKRMFDCLLAGRKE